MDRLDELERLARDATPGPWASRPFQSGHRRLGDVVNPNPTGGAPAWLYKAVNGTEADAAYIAAFSPDTGAALVAVVRAARELAAEQVGVGGDLYAFDRLVAALDNLEGGHG